ncbi:M14 family zinc carboxypeptidase [Stenotrophomonas acidaminiphila]|uniref:M14 family zinc carboxypeptidase n=1 Tax=Stenotrophomonas acidaminiphila TaxID=128780 RepID=UPI002ABE9A3B|nr:M14 family zinc carboxypeptidase [Stenotrophomonas acidaminiphila]WPU56473.1 M14 family zinc carboxypeptidase [Stenotrophomonas acidaminiphila]
MSFRFLALALLLAIGAMPAFAQNSYYFPAARQFDARVPSPQQFLGYDIGSHYTRHDRLVAYFNELARVSDRVRVEVIGQSYEQRPLLLVTITSPRNHARSAQIAAQRQALVDPAQPLPGDDAPSVVWLGYSVHGNETSSGEAAMLTAYYLAANQDAEIAGWLENAVVVIDPAQNPDGRDRAGNWHNAWGSRPPSADPADREHVEPFPTGRVNHYFTDLNRDWLALAQADSWPKVAQFHRWYPNIQIDFHEMGKDSTYYFEPSPKSMESPLLPRSSYEANHWLARFHAQALDALGSLYYTGENFDNFSPIYGSTYPDFHGAVGVTVEQASSRGRVQESVNGPLHFDFTIRNQVATGLASVRGAVEDRMRLFVLQKAFFRSALAQAAAYPVRDWVFGDAADATLTRRLLALLLQHRIQVRALARDVEVDGKRFRAGSAYVVPVRQPQFRLAHAIFEFTPPVKGDVFYSGTSYAVAPAYGLRYAASRGALPTGVKVEAAPAAQGGIHGGRAGFAYVADARDFGSYRLLGGLLRDGVRVRTAHQPFTAATAAGEVAFGHGAVVIPVAGQALDARALQARVLARAQEAGVTVHALDSSRTASGIDLGSDNVRVLRAPSIALVMGEGVSATEIGSAWFALDTALGLPASKLDPAQLASVDLSRYTSIVLSAGSYGTVGEAGVTALKRWIAAGGSLVVYGSGARWAIDKGLVEAKLRGDGKGEEGQRLDFGTVRDVFALGRVSGNILSADIDPTHPLGFGVQQRRIWVNKESGLVFEPGKNAFLNVVNIDRQPVVNGYLSDANRARVAGSSYLQVVPSGSGNVVLFADDPAHRKYWHGTERLLLNALLQGNHLNTPKQRGE